MKLIIVDEPNVSADIFVFAGEDDGKFCLVFDGGIYKATSDADNAELIEKWVMGNERRVFHCHFFRGVWVEYFLDLEIFPFLRECYFLCGAEDGIFCIAEFGNGYGEVEGFILFVFGDCDTEITSGSGCPLVRLSSILATIFSPEGNNLF